MTDELPNNDKLTYQPIFFRIKNKEDKLKYENLLRKGGIVVFDNILQQIKELLKIKNPQLASQQEELQALTSSYIAGINVAAYGVWVYYPWAERLVHLLDEDEFFLVRTARNMYKITPEEQSILRSKKIGVIGLSVGQSIAVTLAMESVVGVLHLADFDTLDLSNMNRLNVGVHELGINKAIIAARKIAELDPYIKTTCFTEGLTPENIDDFFSKNGKLDILVEECDGIDIKILSRLKARELGIPVVMDTNDRGMLDIERFDLEPGRPLFHGNLDENIDLSNLKNLTNQEKLPLLDAMVNLSLLSDKMKYSLSEMGKTINTWPQLASSVMLGGAMVGDTCRRILLSEINNSGRYYIDFNELIK